MQAVTLILEYWAYQPSVAYATSHANGLGPSGV
jgi:hypothetical protein